MDDDTPCMQCKAKTRSGQFFGIETEGVTTSRRCYTNRYTAASLVSSSLVAPFSASVPITTVSILGSTPLNLFYYERFPVVMSIARSGESEQATIKKDENTTRSVFNRPAVDDG